MILYVILFSIALVLLTAIAIAVSVLSCMQFKKKSVDAAVRAAQRQDGEKAFLELYDNAVCLAFLVIDEATRQPVYVSSGIQAFLGVTADEVFYDVQSAKKHIDKKDCRQFEKKYADWDGASVFEQEFAYNGDSYAKTEAFRMERDGSSYIAFTFFDITKQKNKLSTMQKELDSALEHAAAKSSFLSNMSHEIRTPMNGVMGMMSLARMNIQDTEKAISYLDRAGDLSVFLLGMINDILDISKIESGKMQLFNTQMDIFGFADKIRNMYNGTVTGKGIKFVVETLDFTARYVMTDEMRLTQVVSNLVSNASKFTPAGGQITVTFKQLDFIGGNMQLLIRVRDTGKGIAPENIRKIMRPFEQEEASTAHNYGGTGLGLAICDHIVRLMGGNIVIDSVLGKGTDFSVFLSVEVAETAHDMEGAVPAEKTSVAPAEFSYEGIHILLAEDNEINAEIAIEMLEAEGAKVTLAHDGQEAVELFENNPVNTFDLILLDINMPRMNGRDAARVIRKSKRADADSVPIIALSADAFVEDIKLSEEAGMDGHVSKPVDYAELKRCAGEVIAAKEKARS